MNDADIKQSVLKKIREGGVSMRPRAYFVARVAAAALLALAALSAASAIVSFLFFSLDRSGARLLLGFGGRGVLAFFSLFPWGTLATALVAALILEWLLRRFEFGYRIPALVIFAGILALSAGSGALIELTGAHALLLEKADRGELPIVGELYESIRAPHADRGIVRGTVFSVSGRGITVMFENIDDKRGTTTLTVEAPASFDTAALKPGDRIYVAGDVSEGVIRAYGLEKLPAQTP